MNETESIDEVTEATGISKITMKRALDATTDSIREALKEDDKVQLIGFGTFSVSECSTREGTNPLIKEEIQIAARKVAEFKTGAELVDALN